MEISCELIFREYLTVKSYKVIKSEYNLPYLAMGFLNETKSQNLFPCQVLTRLCYCTLEKLAENIKYWKNAIEDRAIKRILVTGGRDYTDRDRTIRVLKNNHPETNTLVAGGASGADSLASNIWRELGGLVEVHPADWDRYGKSAGMVRNAEMFESGLDKVIAFWDCKSRGTGHSIKLGMKYMIEVEVYEYNI